MYAEMTDKQREVNRLLMGETDKDGKKSSISSLNNMLMQMRKNCNHPDLVTAAADGSFLYPPADQLVAECGKMQLLVRIVVLVGGVGWGDRSTPVVSSRAGVFSWANNDGSVGRHPFTFSNPPPRLSPHPPPFNRS